MVHSVADERGVCRKLRDPLRTCAVPDRLRGAFTTRRYTNPRLRLPYCTFVVVRAMLMQLSFDKSPVDL